eukprot:2404842-Prymnesium_polylepis.1
MLAAGKDRRTDLQPEPLLHHGTRIHGVLRHAGVAEVVLKLDGLVAPQDRLEAEVAVRQPREPLRLREDLRLHPQLHRQ